MNAISCTLIRCRAFHGKGSDQNQIRLGYLGGIFQIGAKVEKRGESYEYVEAVIGGTARRLEVFSKGVRKKWKTIHDGPIVAIIEEERPKMNYLRKETGTIPKGSRLNLRRA